MSLTRLLLLLGALGDRPALALEGVVLLQDGTPAIDATVSILGQTGATRTGPEGRFSWAPNPTPPFQVFVILPGGIYTAPVLVQSLPAADEPLVVRLRAALNEAVTVSAGTTPHTEAPPAAAADIVTARDLQQRRPATVTEALEAIPGVGRLDEGHTGVPSIRGLARGRTLILLDGARVTAERRAGPAATYLDPLFLEALEVSRGFGAVAYGSDAFGGVIHARTRRSAPGAPFEGEFHGSFGAGLPERTAGLTLARGLADGGALVQARYRHVADYRSPTGTVRGSSLTDGGARASVHTELGPGRLHAGWQSDRGRDIGKPAAGADAGLTTYPREESDRFYLSYEGDPRPGLSNWSLESFFGRYRLVTRRERVATDTRPRTIGQTDVAAHDYGLRASVSTALRSWRLAGGLDLNGRTGLEAGVHQETFALSQPVPRVDALDSVDSAARHDAAVYLTLDGRLLARLSASAGGRLDRILTRNRGGFFGDLETRAWATSGFAALTAGPWAGLSLTGQVGSGFRDPTLSARYFRGFSGRGFVTGQPGLEAERSLQYDLALRRPGRVRAALYAYRYEIRNLVERYRASGDFFFRNRGRALLRGLELELQADLGAGLSAELGAQAAEGRALDDDAQPLADVPAEAVFLTLRRVFASGGSIFVRGLLQARDGDYGPTEVATPAHGTLAAAITWPLGSHVELRLSARNLLDHDYRQTADEDAAPAPGRSVTFAVSARF